MGLIALKCPHCSGDVQLDEDREFGFCMYCGTKIMIEKTVNITNPSEEKKSSLKRLIRKHLDNNDFSECQLCLDSLHKLDDSDSDFFLFMIEFMYRRYHDTLISSKLYWDKKKFCEKTHDEILELIQIGFGGSSPHWIISAIYKDYKAFSDDTRSLTEIITSFGLPKVDLQKDLLKIAHSPHSFNSSLECYFDFSPYHTMYQEMAMQKVKSGEDLPYDDLIKLDMTAPKLKVLDRFPKKKIFCEYIESYMTMYDLVAIRNEYTFHLEGCPILTSEYPGSRNYTMSVTPQLIKKYEASLKPVHFTKGFMKKPDEERTLAYKKLQSESVQQLYD